MPVGNPAVRLADVRRARRRARARHKRHRVHRRAGLRGHPRARAQRRIGRVRLTGAGDSLLFSGDVLFAGSIGRTDLPGGSMAAMEVSLREVILPLDDATIVHPGHGPSTSIARERPPTPIWRICRWRSPDFPNCSRPSVSSSSRCSTGCGTPSKLHGFAPLETPAVESLDQLTRKGEIEKRGLRPAPAARRRRLERLRAGTALDLTVPFARYVLEHAGHLEFPFRRYQIQKVWRGERPQEGRFREFTQADIDVVARDALPFHHDVEIARVMAEALGSLEFLPRLRLQVNNRKLIEGFYLGLGATDIPAVMRNRGQARQGRPRRRHSTSAD